MKALLFSISCFFSLFSSYFELHANDNSKDEVDSLQKKENEYAESVFHGRLEYFRSSSLFSPLPGATFQKNKNDSYYYCTGLDYAPCNGIFGNDEETHSEESIQNAIDFFQSRKLPFIWWSSDKNLEKKGFQFGGILTAIVLDISNKTEFNQTSPPKLKIKIVKNQEELSAFTKVAINGFGMHPSITPQFHAVNEAGMNHGEQVHFLAMLDEIPVGTATLSTSANSAGIWNLATLEEYRKQGVSTALVSAALEEAKKLRYKHVMAILMPKGLAWGVFTKLGFKGVTEFPFYVYGVSPDELEK